MKKNITRTDIKAEFYLPATAQRLLAEHPEIDLDKAEAHACIFHDSWDYYYNCPCEREGIILDYPRPCGHKVSITLGEGGQLSRPKLETLIQRLNEPCYQCERAATLSALPPMPRLRGTDKQIAWAEKIRARKSSVFASQLKTLSDAFLAAAVYACESAKLWIEIEKSNLPSCITSDNVQSTIDAIIACLKEPETLSEYSYQFDDIAEAIEHNRKQDWIAEQRWGRNKTLHYKKLIFNA